jgi:hypothetical protein
MMMSNYTIHRYSNVLIKVKKRDNKCCFGMVLEEQKNDDG